MRKFLLVLIFLFPLILRAQQVTFGTVDPVGACPANGPVFYINTTSNGFWWCSSNQWNTNFQWSPAVANKFVVGPISGGTALPTIRNLVSQDLPLPTTSTIGGVQSFAAVSHQWLNAVSLAGVFSSTQPTATDLVNGANGAGAVLLQQLVVSNQTANYSVLTGDSGKTFTNAGAVGAVTFQLPTCAAGLWNTYDIQSAQTFTIKAGVADKIRNAATLSAANGTAVASTVGNTVTVECIGASPSEWDFISVIGSWTVT